MVGVQGWVLGVLSFWVCFRGGVGEFVVSFALGLFGWGLLCLVSGSQV